MSLLEPTRPRDRHVATRIAVTFFVAGIVWVFTTDRILNMWEHDTPAVQRIETAKGWVFVFVAAIFIYEVARRQVARLQRSEATTRAIVASISDGILLVGKDGRIADANPAAMRMLGVTDKREILGMSAEEFSVRFHWSYPNGTLVPPQQYISQRVLRGEPVGPYKAVLFPKSGPALTISADAAPVRSAPGDTPQLAVSVMRDITALEALDRLRDEFFAAAAHSLKTPVTVIRSHAQLLVDRADAEQDRNAASTIDRQCGQIERLVQNLLVLARLQSGTIRFHPKRFPLLKVADRVTRKMQSATPHHTIQQKAEADPEVVADPERVSQALENLIDWAMTVSPPGSELEVHVRKRDHQAELGVTYHPWAATDEGHPMYAGLNVGRHVSERLVEALGGRLRVEEGVDSQTDWIDLPIAEEEVRAS